MGVRRLAVLIAALLAFGIAGAVAAGAQQNDSFLLIRGINSSDPERKDPNSKDPWKVDVNFIYTGNQGDLNGLKLTEKVRQEDGSDQINEVKPDGAPAKIDADKGLVVVFDTSLQMDKDGGLIRARDSVKKLVDNSTNTRIAIVQAGEKADIKTDFTADKDKLKTTIDSIGPTPKGAAIWEALRQAGSMFYDPNSSGTKLQPNILLITASNDTLTAATEAQGRTAVLKSGATFFAVERMDQGLDPTSYNSLVAKAGGQVYTANDPAGLEAPIASVGDVIQNKQYRLTYTSQQKYSTPTTVELTVNGQTSNGTFFMGSNVQGGERLRPEIIEGSTALGFLKNPVAFAVALLLALLAVAGIAYSITSLFVRDDLSSVLQPYADAYGGEFEDDESSALGKSALIQRAVEITEQVAKDQGFHSRTEASLERANLPLRAGEALFIYVIIVVVATVFGLLLFKNLIGALILGGVAALIPPSYVNMRANRRRKAFMSQLPDTLQLLSGTLRAGYSLMQGVEAVSQEVDDPMGIELRRVCTEARLGRPLEESLEASAERMDSPDFAWAVMAIRIQREVGGNLSELLMTVADTMVARERLRRDVAALTAEGRMSAYVLGALPAGLGVLMFMLNPEYVGVLFTDGLGIGMLITAVVAMLIGFFWMKKIITIEI